MFRPHELSVLWSGNSEFYAHFIWLTQVTYSVWKTTTWLILFCFTFTSLCLLMSGELINVYRQVPRMTFGEWRNNKRVVFWGSVKCVKGEMTVSCLKDNPRASSHWPTAPLFLAYALLRATCSFLPQCLDRVHPPSYRQRPPPFTLPIPSGQEGSWLFLEKSTPHCWHQFPFPSLLYWFTINTMWKEFGVLLPFDLFTFFVVVRMSRKSRFYH